MIRIYPIRFVQKLVPVRKFRSNDVGAFLHCVNGLSGRFISQRRVSNRSNIQTIILDGP